VFDPTDDIRSMMDTAELASASTWTPGVGEPVDVVLLFSRNPQAVNLATGEIETTSPVARAIASDVTGIAIGETVTIGSQTYYITAVSEPTDMGLLKLTLSEDAP